MLLNAAACVLDTRLRHSARLEGGNQKSPAPRCTHRNRAQNFFGSLLLCHRKPRWIEHALREINSARAFHRARGTPGRSSRGCGGGGRHRNPSQRHTNTKTLALPPHRTRQTLQLLAAHEHTTPQQRHPSPSPTLSMPAARPMARGEAQAPEGGAGNLCTRLRCAALHAWTHPLCVYCARSWTDACLPHAPDPHAQADARAPGEWQQRKCILEQRLRAQACR